MAIELKMAPDATAAAALSHAEEAGAKPQARNPFKELKLNGFGEDAEDTKHRNASKDGAFTQWEEFELSLSEFDRNQMTPFIDGLIGNVSCGLFSDGPGDDALLRAAFGNVRISAQPAKTAPAASGALEASRPLQTKKAWGEKPLERTRTPEQEVLIKASYVNRQGPALQNRQNLSTMIAEKSSLKRELRSIDLEFEAREGRKPTKAEKEHLRPLYVRYWKLKHQIGKLQGAAAANAKVAAVH